MDLMFLLHCPLAPLVCQVVLGHPEGLVAHTQACQWCCPNREDPAGLVVQEGL